MRHPLLPACVAALLWAMPAPGHAQDASDCGVLCRLTGYLSSDHMTAEPGHEAAAGTPPKPHKTRAAAVHKAAAPAKPVTAAIAAAPVAAKPAVAAPAARGALQAVR